MKPKFLMAVLAALMFAGCAGTTPTASDSAASQPVAPAAADAQSADSEDPASDVLARTEKTGDAEDRVICRTITPTGSHRKKTICRTVAEIKQDRQSAQDALRTKQGAAIEGAGDL